MWTVLLKFHDYGFYELTCKQAFVCLQVKEVHLVETKIYVDTRKQYLLICMFLYAGMHVFRTSVIPLLMERIRRENNLLIIYIKYDNKSFHGWLNVI